MEGFKDPYSGMNFDPTNFDKAITKTKESFDSTIQEAGMQAGMTAGNTGLNPSRVTADVYSKAMGGRDATLAQQEGQKAQAMAEFNMQKQQLTAQAKADYEKNKPGFMDWLSGGLGVASSIVTMNPGGIFGGVQKLAGNFGSLNYKAGGAGTGSLTQRQPSPVVNNTVVTPPTVTDNSGMTTFNPSTYNPFKQKKTGQYNWGLK